MWTLILCDFLFTVESQFNKPLYNKVLGNKIIINDILHPSSRGYHFTSVFVSFISNFACHVIWFQVLLDLYKVVW